MLCSNAFIWGLSEVYARQIEIPRRMSTVHPRLRGGGQEYEEREQK